MLLLVTNDTDFLKDACLQWAAWYVFGEKDMPPFQCMVTISPEQIKLWMDGDPEFSAKLTKLRDQLTQKTNNKLSDIDKAFGKS